MLLTGQHLISGVSPIIHSQTFQTVNPATGKILDVCFSEGTDVDISIATSVAEKAFAIYRKTSGVKRAELLESIVAELNVLKEQIINRAHLETALPETRLEGEFGRTVHQLNMFAQLIRNDDYKHIRIDQGLPQRKPLPRPDVRLTHVPIGPVAVFGASNFPLAFSVAGGDTAAALAAGCSVVVKGHPTHPGASELAGLAIQRALHNIDLPGGVFSLIQGREDQVGSALVQDPRIGAVAFTGSHAGGRSLFNLAAARPNPIPVFAEMGSVNPTFVLPLILKEKYKELARKYTESLTLGVGQFCTNPGLLFVLKGAEGDSFIHSVKTILQQVEPLPMLHLGIKKNYQSKIKQLLQNKGVSLVVGSDSQSDNDCYAAPALLVIEAEDFHRVPNIVEEIFGPSSVIVQCETLEQMLELAGRLSGQLTATVHAHHDEKEFCRQFFSVLETKAGRLILNDFPTGVEVCSAMHHGGPYPATTDSRFSSVGETAIQRFLRPVCYQNFFDELLPLELQKNQEKQG